MKWKDKLIKDVITSTSGRPEALEIFRLLEDVNINIHLAVFNEPFLSLVFSGSKTMESRFSLNKVCPFREVADGDVVLLKKSGGAVCGFFTVKGVKYYSNLNSKKISHLDDIFGDLIGWKHDEEFLSNKSTAKYLTLITIGQVYRLPEILSDKSDRTGWAVVKRGLNNTLFKI